MVENMNKRSGVGICVISRGTVSMDWMLHMDKLRHFIPVGLFWKYVIVQGEDGYAVNRIKVIQEARKQNFEWVLFIDDDVFVPYDVIQKLLSHQKDVVTGVYWVKGNQEDPVIFEKEGAGPMYNFPVGELFKIAGSGLGCCLINMKVFDAFEKEGIPFFKENWVLKLPDGRNMKCSIGEDHYFFHMAQELGFDTWCDGNILCDHYDVNKKIYYPSRDTVRKLCAKKLENLGKKDTIIDYKNKHGQDPNKKTIAFVNYTMNSFNGNTLNERPCGGSETDIINLSRIFANDYNYNVHVFCLCDKPGVYDNVVYHELNTGMPELRNLNADLLVVSRNAKIFGEYDFKKDVKAKKVCLWCHDLPGDPAYDGLEDTYKSIDYIFALTKFHKDALMKHYPFLEEKKMFIAENGINMGYFKDRDKVKKVPGRMIYSSTPFRGLNILAKVFNRIKERVPNVTLKVFSSMKVYGDAYDDGVYGEIYQQLRETEGIEYCGSIKQKDLAKEMMEAEVLAYPNTYAETCCITVMEAQTAGTPIVTSNYAALKETVPDECGIKIKGDPKSEEYQNTFVDSVVELLTNKEKWTEMHKNCLKQDYTWKTVAKKWIEKFFTKETIDCDDIKQAGNINTVEYWNTTYKKEIDAKRVRFNKASSDKILEYIKDGDKLLDIGCGTGEFTRYVKTKLQNCEVWGSDFSTVAIDFCRAQSKSIYYANHPIMNPDYEKHTFDIITIQHVLEHLEKPEEMIEKAFELLKKDGKLILVFPINDDKWREHLKIWNFNDVEELLRKFDTVNNIFYIKNKNRKYDSDGRYFEEAIIIMEEDKNGN